MTKDQIKQLQSLDPKGMDGTFQSILLQDNLHETPYVKVLEFLVSTLKKEKDFLISQNIELSSKAVSL